MANWGGVIILAVVLFAAVILFMPGIIPSIDGINFQNLSDDFWAWINGLTGGGVLKKANLGYLNSASEEKTAK